MIAYEALSAGPVTNVQPAWKAFAEQLVTFSFSLFLFQTNFSTLAKKTSH